jgi:predicted outer membrane repeat protein
LEASTFSTNRAAEQGGGIYVADNGIQTGPVPVLTLDSLTIAFNVSKAGGGIFNADLNPVAVRNSIIGRNLNATGLNDVTGIFTSSGFNLVQSDGSTGTVFIGDVTSITSVDPKLGALAFNGGPTQTHLLLAGSAARNNGNTSLTTDQRGFPRPGLGNPAKDIGAVEM